MPEALRVSTAEFKSNVRPFVLRARQGQRVIVTKSGRDYFQIIPCDPVDAPPVAEAGVDPAKYEGIDVDEPAFGSWNESID